MKGMCDEQLSIKLGRAHNYLSRMKRDYPDMYKKIFSFSQSRQISLRLYEQDLQEKQRILRELPEWIIIGLCSSSYGWGKSIGVNIRTIYKFIDKEDDLINSNINVIDKVYKMLDELDSFINEYKDIKCQKLN